MVAKLQSEAAVAVDRPPSRRSAAVLLFALASAALADIPVGPNEQLSRNAAGSDAGNAPSLRPTASIDAEFVAFYSSADNLLPGGADGNGRSDVFLWRADTGEIEVVSSTDPAVTMADGSSDVPTISPDGRFVVFNSWASNLPGGNGVCQTFLLDRGDPLDPLPQRTVELVSAVTDSAPPVAGNGQCATTGLEPSVSDDGRFVGFSSTSTNLVADDLQTDLVAKRWQVFVRDRDTDKTYRLPDPADPEEESPNGASWEVKLDASGRRAVFASAASDIPYGDQDGGLIDLFIWQLPEGGGPPSITGRIDADAASSPLRFDISGDGRWVVFDTWEPLDPDDEPNTNDAYLVAIDGGEPPRNVTAGIPASVSNLSISHDGRFVAISDNQFPYSNLWVWDAQSGDARKVVYRLDGSQVRGVGQPEISPDGRSLVFQSSDAAIGVEYDNNRKSDVYRIVNALAVLDPQPALRTDRPIDAVLADTDLLGSDELPWRRGMATDGVTRTVLRFLPKDGTGAVRFRLVDEAGGTDHVGGLKARTAAGGAPVVDLTVPVETLADGRLAAFAQWLAPDRFARGPPPAAPQDLDCGLDPVDDRCLARRPVTLEISYSAPDGTPVTLIAGLDLERPPLAMLHGIWGDRDTWRWQMVDDPRFTIHRHDYSPTHSDHFVHNLFRPRDAAEAATAKARAGGIAATQADLIGHSMGGLLARLYLALPVPPQRTPLNLDAGPIRTLITLGTPFEGSALACLLLELIELDGLGGSFKDLFEDLVEGCVDCGGVADLRPGSHWLDSIRATSSEAGHVLVSVAGSELVDLGIAASSINPEFLLLDLTLRLLESGFDEVFGPGERHDLIVSETSQSAGLSGGQRTVFGLAPSVAGTHTHQTDDDRFGDAAAWLLDTPRDDGTRFSAGFPATTSQACEPFVTSRTPALVALDAPSTGGGIVITAPAPGAVLSPGSLFDVVVEPQGGLAIERVLILTPHGSALVESPPYSATFEVAAEALGNETIAAVARDAAGNLYPAEVGTTVETTEALVGIRLEPAGVALGPERPRLRLRLLGLYDSGVERNLTDAGMGAGFSSLHPEIASVDAEGRVVARRPGRALVVADLAGLAAETEVVVEGPAPFLDGPWPATPGEANAFLVHGATPGATVALYRGVDPGGTTTGVCPGAPLALDAATRVAAAPADAEGEAALALAVPASDAGHVVFYQALDESGCLASARRDVAYGNRDRIGPAPALAPRGPTFDPEPFYRWGDLAGATGYELEVLDGGSLVTAGGFDPATGCSGGRCEGALDALLPAAYGWRVRTSDVHGRGPWSAEASFEVLACDPPPGTTVPGGDVSGLETHYDCQSVVAGEGVTVLGEGRLVLHGGEWSALDDGFTLESGGELEMRADP